MRYNARIHGKIDETAAVLRTRTAAPNHPPAYTGRTAMSIIRTTSTQIKLDITGSLEKLCLKCGETKRPEEFGKDRTRPDGRFPYCKRCRLKDPEESDHKAAMRASGKSHCPRCEQWLDVDMFYNNRSRADGIATQCKRCYLEMSREYRAKYPERVRAYHRRRYARPHVKKMYRDYYYKNRDRIIRREVERSRTPNGRARQARLNHLRRIRNKSVPATLTDEQWQLIIRNQKNRCLMCGERFSQSLPPTRDHIDPVAKGGGLTVQNVAALCKPCNSSKRDRPAAYTAQRGLL